MNKLKILLILLVMLCLTSSCAHKSGHNKPIEKPHYEDFDFNADYN